MSHNPFFDSLAELARDPGAIGDVFRQLPDWEWIFSESDRWPNPWEFLLGIRNVTQPFKRLFKAGQSQRIAWMRIIEIAIGAGTIEKSWFQELDEAEKAGDLKLSAHAREKVVRAIWQFDRQMLTNGVDKLSKPAECTLRKIDRTLYEKTRRKHGRFKADDLRCPSSRFKFETMTQRIAWELASGWLRNRGCAPGYCFFSDSALRDLLEILLGLPQIEFDTVRKTRQSVGLRKAPTIFYGLKRLPDGSLQLLDRSKKPVWTVATIHSSGKK